MRIAGKGRSMASYKWMREAKESDTYDPGIELIEPFFLEGDL